MRCHFVQSFPLSLHAPGIVFVAGGDLDVSSESSGAIATFVLHLLTPAGLAYCGSLAAAAVHQSHCQEVKYRKNENYQ